MEGETKKRKGPIIAIVILIIVIIGLVGVIGYIAYDKGVFSDKKTNQATNSDKEVEITDKKLITDLYKKVSILNRSDDSRYPSTGRNIYNLTELTSAEKLRKVLMGSDKFSQDITEEDKKTSMDSTHLIAKASVSDIEDLYQQLFGTKITSYSETKSTGCPSFEYNENNKVYYLYGDCSGLEGEVGLIYVNKATKKKNEAYIYVNIGTYIKDYYGSGEKNVYDGIEQKTVVDKATTDDYKIDEKNYTKFSEYKYTFTKDENDNYHFTKIEKVNK